MEFNWNLQPLMPDEKLSTFVENVSKTQINEIEQQLRSAQFVDDGDTLKMPKFKFNYDLELNKI